jgi:hypothetical protein
MMAKILIFLSVFAAVSLVVVAFQPDDFQITRHIAIMAPVTTVFERVNDFHRWIAWSPWEKMDPAMARTYAGSNSGPGAVYSWAGNREVGSGRMTLIESRPGARILIQLEFFKPQSGLCPMEFIFKPDGDRTIMTWTMSGQRSFAAKVASLFSDMDKRVGGQFETGLERLKALAEAGTQSAHAANQN